MFKPPLDFAIITALEKEARAVTECLEEHHVYRDESHDIRTYHLGRVTLEKDKFYRIAAIQLTQMGNVSASIAVADTIHRWRPRYILMVGIAGGFPQDDLDLGDVVIASQVVGYDYGKITPQGLQPRDRVFPASALLMDRVGSYWDPDWAQAVNYERPANAKRALSKRFIGTIASGNKVVADQVFRGQLLARWSKLHAVEMEAEGVYAAAFDRPHPENVLVIRGISDMADERKSDQWQEYAAHAAAAYMIGFLKSGPVDPYQPKPKGKKKRSKAAAVKNEAGGGPDINLGDINADKGTVNIAGGDITTNIYLNHQPVKAADTALPLPASLAGAFLSDPDTAPLTEALTRFAVLNNESGLRLSVLKNAGVHDGFISSLKLSDPANQFAIGLVARFRQYPVSSRRPGYHPMLSFLSYILTLDELASGLNDQDLQLCETLAARARQLLGLQ